MNEWFPSPIEQLLESSFAGEWGAEPTNGRSDVTVYRGADFQSSGRLRPDAGVPRNISSGKIRKVLLKPGDILLEKSGGSPDQPVGRVSIYEGHAVSAASSNFLQTLRPRDTVDAEFLFYLLANEYQRGRVLPFQQQTTGLINFRLKDYLKEIVRLPSEKSEQRRIAELLSTMDEQIEQTEAESNKLAQLIPGAFDDLFGQGMADGLSTQALKYGELKKGWTRLPVSIAAPRILDFRGRTPLKLGMQWGGGNIPALSANNVEMGKVNFQKESYFASVALYKKWMTQGDCQKNDVLMTLEAPLGNVALVPDDNKYILSQRVILLKPDTELLNGPYLHLYMRWRWFQALLTEESTGTTATGIQRKKLERLPVLIAPESERNVLVEFLSGLLEQQSILQINLSKLRLEKQGLMQVLLTGKVRFPC